MTIGLSRYLKEAFFATFAGMFVSPSMVILGIAGFLGVMINPGFLVMGAGIEFAYLFLIATHPRFQSYINHRILAELAVQEREQRKQRSDQLVGQLSASGRERFLGLDKRCSAIMDFYSSQLLSASSLIDQHGQSLNKLVWIFLQLLVAQEAVVKLMQGGIRDPKAQDKFSEKILELESQIAYGDLAPDLRKSLESKRDILKMRLQALLEAKQKLLYIESELDRIEQQVELIREQAVVNRDSQMIGTSIDSVSSSLNQTNDWIKQQEGFLGGLAGVGESIPPVITIRTEQGETR
jgi:hypothetical protein